MCCSYCSDIRDLGPYTQERTRIEKAFVEGIEVTDGSRRKLKKLNDKISDHGKCVSHKKMLRDNSISQTTFGWQQSQEEQRIMASSE